MNKKCHTALRATSFDIVLPDNHRGGAYTPKDGFEDELFKVKHVNSVGGPHLGGNIIIELDSVPDKCGLAKIMKQCKEIVEKYL